MVVIIKDLYGNSGELGLPVNKHATGAEFILVHNRSSPVFAFIIFSKYSQAKLIKRLMAAYI